MAAVIPQVVTEDRASGAQVIDGSLRFDSAKSTDLRRTPASGGNRRVFTLSFWVKKNENGSYQRIFGTASPQEYIRFDNDDVLRLFETFATLETNQVFRDNSWYHIVIAVDSTQSSSSDRINLYVNGSQVTDFGTETYPSQNADCRINTAVAHYLGSGTVEYLDGSISQFYFIEGQQLDSSYFGFTDPLTNTWRPKKASITGPNDGTVWSGGSYTGTTPASGYGVAEAFNGVGFPGDDFGSGVQWGFFPGTATLTLGKPITLKSDSTFEIYSYHSSSSTGSITFTCSNGSVAPSLTVNSSNIIGSTVVSNPFSTFGAQITAITLVSSGSDWTAIAGIAVDGVVLMDSDTTNFGPNGFYLPMDGNTPVGNDESGRGNDWTPTNMGGTVGLDKATGALPILNTNGGGTVAHVGVRTDVHSANVVLALPLVGDANDVSNVINPGSSAKTITITGNAAPSVESSNFYNGSFDFDGSGDYLTASNSSDFNPGTGDFCIEGWFKTSASVSYQTLISVYGAPSSYHGWYFGLDAAGTGFRAAITDGSSGILTITGGTNLNDGRWHHFAVCRTGTTAQLFIDGVSVATHTNSYNITATSGLRISGYTGTSRDWNGQLQDIRIYKGTGKYTSNFLPASTNPDILSDTPSGVATKTVLTKINEGSVAVGAGGNLNFSDSTDFDIGIGGEAFTVEAFVYPNSNGTMAVFGRGGGYAGWNSTNGHQILLTQYSGNHYVQWWNGSALSALNGTTHFYKVKTWHHVALAYDGTTVKLFVNGQQSLSGAATFGKPSSSNIFRVGDIATGSYNWDGFISNFRLIKGTCLYTSEFTPPSAPLTNVTNTKLLCCHDPLSAVGSIVTPGSFTASGDAAGSTFNPFNTDINTIRGQETSYCTLNQLDSASSGTLSNGNLRWASGTTSHYAIRSTLGMRTGKYYAEATVIGNPTTNGSAVGIALKTATLVSYIGVAGGYSYHTNGNKYVNNTGSSFGAAYGATLGNVVGFTFDADNGNLDAYLNGTYVGNIVSGLDQDDYYWAASAYNFTWEYNFGQKPFKFPPPDGFQALTASSARPETVVPDGSQYVQATTYTGNGATQKITTGLKPDLVWLKARANAYHHRLYDSVRGLGSLRSDNTGTVNSDVNSTLRTYDADGFTLLQNSDEMYNANSSTYIAWTWRAGGNKNTFNVDDVGYATAAAAGLTGGGYDVTGASVGTKQGFSIIQWEKTGSSGAYVMPHGLTQAPKFIITRNFDIVSNWGSYHYNYDDGAGTYGINFNSTSAASSSSGWWNNTGPTSTQFSLGTFFDDNGTFIAYLWHDVAGLQKFGTYTGNGSTDGPMVETGFRPRIVWTKASGGSGGNWSIYDTARSVHNVAPERLYPNLTSIEETSAANMIDILSNGFKLRHSNAQTNASGTTYVYCAWAEAPTNNMFGASSNAR